MVKAVLDELSKPEPKNHFTVGINDDVSHTSLDVDTSFSIEPEETVRCVFFGLGSDGTVGANKNSIKIIGEETDNYAQGYFYLRLEEVRHGDHFAPALWPQAHPCAVPDRAPTRPISWPATSSPSSSGWICSSMPSPGGVFLLNSLYGPEEIWDNLPREVQTDIMEKKLKFYVINGYEVAEKTGMGGRMNTIMQTAFFAISGILPREAGHCRDQARHREDLWQARRSRGAEELRGGGQHHRQSVRGQGSGKDHFHR